MIQSLGSAVQDRRARIAREAAGRVAKPARDVQRPAYIASLDSTTCILLALARYLHGRDFPLLGMPRALEAVAPLTPMLNLLGARQRALVYGEVGRIAAWPPSRLARVDMERISAWVTAQYPRRRTPVAMIGSSNGALAHLCAALGAPWLPQTFLIPVRRRMDPDDIRGDMTWAVEPARALLAANPELELHHMHDPVHDRPMLPGMAYFRVKRLRLGAAYEAFLEESVEPGGTLVLVECRQAWPTTLAAERHVFQAGGYGDTSLQEYFGGGEEVERFLARHGSRLRRWDPPEPDAERPEAEWGFAPALRDDVERFARERGLRLVRLVFESPEALSPLAADLYCWWLRERGLPADRLLVESFCLLEPWWALRTGSVPLWLVFNTERDADRLEAYLDAAEARGDPFRRIDLMLLSNAVECIRLAPIERWRRILDRAGLEGRFVGVDERAFPHDLATFARYHHDVRKIPARHPMPGPLPLAAVEGFVRSWRGETAEGEVRWIEG